MAWWFGRSREKPRANTADAPPTAEEMAARVHRFLLDDALQNRKLPLDLQEQIARAPSVDEVPGGSGAFGRAAGNPIPANGPFGEAQYLSSLVTSDGQPIAFQRLGTVGAVDIFETVTLDGRRWDCLYLSMFFPRKSQLAPSGFRFAQGSERSVLIRGTIEQAEDFPVAIHTLAERFTKGILGVSIADPRLRALQATPVRLPVEHQELLQRLRFGEAAATGGS